MGVYAKVIADSISTVDNRLTTMEVQCHRFVLAEFNTHRKFSRNSASSRAIPVAKQIARIESDLAYPLAWPAEQKGMQGGEELTLEHTLAASDEWRSAATHAITSAKQLQLLGVHKSVTNRLLEPFMWHKIIVSSTEWDNFFTQRCSPLAQPEIRAVAEAMQKALRDSTPEELGTGEWHLPYLDADDKAVLDDEEQKAVSAARCARVSYLTHDGVRDLSEDIKLYNRLTESSPPHWSPLEHVAVVDRYTFVLSNFDGWTQLRSIVGANA